MKVIETVTASEKTHSASDIAPGVRYWRSLEEYAGTPEVREWIEREFPSYEPDELLKSSRRGFLKLAGASMALAGLTLTGCRRWPAEKLAPYATRPPGHTPGESEYYATIFEHGGAATGLLVEAFDGRPIKVEGNPNHPYSLGATDAFAQASVLTMYDPDRSRVVAKRRDGVTGVADATAYERQTWEQFEAYAKANLQPANTAFLVESCSSPTLRRLRDTLQGARWFTYDAVGRASEIEGSRQAFGGRAIRAVLNLEDAKVIAAFDADLLNNHPGGLRYSRQWAKGRTSADASQRTMNRLYVAESAFTCTGSVADERVPVQSSRIVALLAAVAHGLGVQAPSQELKPREQQWVDALVKDLQAHRGTSVVSVGASQPAAAHALAWQINGQLGNLGQTVLTIEEPFADAQGIAQLVEAINAGQVESLVILGGNPVFDAPGDVDFAGALAKVKNSVHHALYLDETSLACTWHLPASFYLEAWGDGLAWDGTYGIGQPIILPLYETRSAIEVLSLLAGRPAAGYDLVRETFASRYGGGTLDEKRWRKALHDGVLEGSEAPVLDGLTPAATAVQLPAIPPADEKSFEITFQPGTIGDGRWANNGWLLELPHPVSKEVWGNSAWMNIHDAQTLGVKNAEHIAVQVNGKTLELPVYQMPGQARGSIALLVGYGRQVKHLSLGNAVGVNVSPLRSAASPGIATGAQVVKGAGHTKLLLTQNHHMVGAVGQMALDARVGTKGESGIIIKEATLDEYAKKPDFVHYGTHGDYSLQMYEEPKVGTVEREDGSHDVFRNPHAWGMTIDMATCIGCSACMVACNAENNIPVVGPQMVDKGREMHWIRIDRYFKSATDDGHGEHADIVWQPMMCVHCENAPCEQVCPVAATVHDTEGLNTMVYNRCIGTRYCSNNCPYKVRRFNYFDYHSKPLFEKFPLPWLGMPDSQQRNSVDPIRQLGFNPDVTVRMRGVMEKCTYCTQRLWQAKITAKIEWQNGRREQPLVHEGEVVTACQQSCPTNAITFGNLNDAESRVSQLKRVPRNYAVLDDLNTRPRTTYLAKITNPATAPKAAKPAEAH